MFSCSLEVARAVLFVVSRVGGLTALEIAEEAGVDAIDALGALFGLERLGLVSATRPGGAVAAFWFPARDAYRARV